ncbi:MAG: cyanophycinase [Bacteroidales bacterium]|nr:cyanophycinase [Bacteroidales bacterium]
MQRLISAIIILAILFNACNHAETTDEPKGKLFIIGGGKRPSAMIQRMIREAGLDRGGFIVILPMASSEPDTSVFYATKQFKEQGINNIAGFCFSKEAMATPGQIDSLEKAALIYITGGDQNTFMDIVAGTTIEQAIKTCFCNGGMIAGTSAGAAVMSEKMITGNELKQTDYRDTFRTIEADNIELGTGLRLITSAIIDQHFVWRSRHNRLITAVIEHPELKGIGIDEATAILVIGNTAEVVGESQVLIYENSDRVSITDENGKFGAPQLTLRVLLPGDTFRLQ